MTASLHIDLDVLAANIGVVQRRVAPAELMLVVKDDAYGHGLEPVVRRAWDAGVRWIGAFDVRTGRDVRVALGPDAEIFVWLVVGEAEALMAVELGLHIGVGDSALLDDIAAAAAALSTTALVHLKIDTGLHRNGIRPEEWPAVVARAHRLQQDGFIDVVGVWSHIAEASDHEDDLSREEFDRAWSAASALQPRMRHLAASAASFARPAFRYDLVRVGAFCYGIRPSGGPSHAELGIRPISALTAQVTVAGSERVRADIGALDGIPSSLAGLIDVGTPAGPRRLLSVLDDAIEIEKWEGAAPGDSVTIWGGRTSPTDAAEAIDTIGEEIALRVSPALPRQYH